MAELSRSERGRVSWGVQASADWKLVERTWDSTHALTFLYPGKYFAIKMFWSKEDWRFLCWYVNFQRPYRRTATGFDALDLALDIIVNPDDLSIQQAKDLDQYEAGIECGGITESDAAGVESARADTYDLTRLGLEPFVSDWTSWRPGN